MAEVVEKEIPVVVKEAAVGPAYVVKPPILDIDDLILIRESSSYSLYRIPFGRARGELTIRHLVNMDWKKRKGKDFEEVAKKHGALLEANKLARKISKAYAGTKGVVRVVLPDGTVTYYPRKALAQKRWRKEHPELVREYEEKVKPKAYKPKY